MFGLSWKTIAVTAGIAFAVDVLGDVTGLRARVSGMLSK
jgi:hypothetical protein